MVVVMTNQSYKIQCYIYKPIASKCAHLFLIVVLHEQTPKSIFSQMWEVGASNIWVANGPVCPHNTVGNKSLHFLSVSLLLKFVDEGKNGLFG